MADIETLRQQIQSRAPFSTWLGVVCLFALFGAIVLAVIGPSPRGNNYEQSRTQKRVEKLKTLTEANAKQLSTYGWVDKNKGSVHLPIERAMELTVADLSAKQPAPAYPIATPEAQAASPAPAPSVQPRGSAKATSPSPIPSPTTAGSHLPVRPAPPTPAPKGQ